MEAGRRRSDVKLSDPAASLRANVFHFEALLQIEPTSVPGVLLLTPRRYGDHCGFFAESYNRLRMSEVGIGIEFVQDNHSLSEAVGTIRGLHFQAPPHAQDRLIRYGRGAFLDVAIDARRGSLSYGR